MKTITVDASKKYEIVIGEGIMDGAGSAIRKAVGGRIAAMVTDDRVDALYGKRLERTLAENGYRVVRYTFSQGEASKTTGTLVSLADYLAEENVSRTDVVVAFGGGVAGDLAGLAAACYMRGIRFIQMPTTLLAAVDSSVGGKTAVNLSAGKNLFGAFYQPDLVLCDVDLLSTLPPDVYRDGCAEVVKYGMIADRELFWVLEKPIYTQLADIIARCVQIKSDIVAEDEYEKGKRKWLNFGHTIGHAIELLSGFQTSHGYAVAAGMAIETRIALSMGVCEAACLADLLVMLRQYGLPDSAPYSAEALAHACLSDKKRDGDYLTMAFPTEIGKCVLKEIPMSELESLIGAAPHSQSEV